MSSSPPLPFLLTWPEIQQRLELVFPDGTPQRAWLIRDVCAKTVFAMLYVGATEGRDVFLAPKHVYRMSDKQADLVTDVQRTHYAVDCLTPGFQSNGKQWFADTSREPIRDESLREGLVPVGAVGARQGVPTTSNKPRYFLFGDFAALFSPNLSAIELEARITAWQTKHLTKAALIRAKLIAASNASTTAVSVRLPDGTTRHIEAGPTQQIALQFFEVFVPRFFTAPHVVFFSQSGNKQPIADEVFAKTLGLNINASELLPDLIIAETHPELLLVFVEFVATDGPINPRRQTALAGLVPHLQPHQVAFVTAFVERAKAPFRSKFAELAWNSFAWCAAEPEHLIALFDSRPSQSLKLTQLVRAMHDDRS